MSGSGLKQAEAHGDAARLLLAASRERFAVAAADLLLPARSRLSEWQRSTASALLQRLVRSVEDSLRSALVHRFASEEALHAALGSTNVAIALPLLERSGVLRDGELGTVLVRRVEEHRYWKENAPQGGEDILSELVRDEGDSIAAEAMSLLLARSRRFDRFQEPLLGQTDLPADLQHRLVWMTAAALRHYMVQQHRVPSGAADAAISAAAGELIAGYDEGRTLEASCMRLCRALFAAGRLEGAALARMLDEGLLPLFVAAIAVRCALDYPAAWEVFSDPQARGPALLLRAGGIARPDAAAILLTLNSRGRLFSGVEGDAATPARSVRRNDRGSRARSAASLAGRPRLPSRHRPTVDPPAFFRGRMTARVEAGLTLVRGSVDSEGRLVEADPALASLHERAGGRPGGDPGSPADRRPGAPRSPPRRDRLPSSNRRRRRRRSRPVGSRRTGRRASPAFHRWLDRAAGASTAAAPAELESDFVRAAVDWVWETDETLRLTMLSPAATPRCTGRPPR
jgi:uncharacterized protein (DUF2336 family)